MPQVRKYKAEVVSIVNPVDNIYTLELQSLSGRFKYLPGQFLHLALDEYDPSFGWPESRCFSMQSSPDDEVLKITFSVKGNFTGRMAVSIEKGQILDLKLPFGNLFQQEHSKENVVFIAGGTGITPFLSAFNDPSFSRYEKPRLYFGVRSVDYNIYSQYLLKASKINPFLKVRIKYQNPEGILNIDEIFNENKLNSTYFISGPQIMISEFRARLISLGLRERDIITDEWE